MSIDIINLPQYTTPLIMHYGFSENYARFCNSYFEKNQGDKTIKHVIENVTYQSDSLYSNTDGMVGRCWIVIVHDCQTNAFHNYYIRNWVDIAHYYEQNNFKFIIVNKHE